MSSFLTMSFILLSYIILNVVRLIAIMLSVIASVAILSIIMPSVIMPSFVEFSSTILCSYADSYFHRVYSIRLIVATLSSIMPSVIILNVEALCLSFSIGNHYSSVVMISIILLSGYPKLYYTECH